MVSGVARLAFRKPKTCRKCFPKIEKRRREGGKGSDWAAFALELEIEDSSQGEEDGGDEGWDEEERRRICRCRQGRNHQSRERVALVKMLYDTSFASNHIKEECWNCNSTDIVFDYGRSEASCSDCGAVVADVVVWGDIDGALVRSKSKPYQTLVYMREKLRGLHGSDPEIWPEEWDSILLRMQEVYGQETYKSLLEATLGKSGDTTVLRGIKASSHECSKKGRALTDRTLLTCYLFFFFFKKKKDLELSQRYADL